MAALLTPASLAILRMVTAWIPSRSMQAMVASMIFAWTEPSSWGNGGLLLLREWLFESSA